MLVGDADVLRTAKDERQRVIGKWSKLRCNCVLLQHTWYIM